MRQMKLPPHITLTILFISSAILAQDSLNIPKNKSGFRLGTKIITERTGMFNLLPGTYPLYGCGAQFIKPLKLKYFSIESGFYLVKRTISNKPDLTQSTYRTLYRNISIPVCLRLESKNFYFSAGPQLDYFMGQELSQLLNQSGIYTRKLYYGFNSSIGLQYPFKKTMIAFVEGRFSKIVSTKFGDPSFTNIGFAFGFNYRFGYK
jgi:hypothetical protein